MTTPFVDRVLSRRAMDADAEDHAIREALQELVLYGLSESGFFSSATFHGGTFLRIVHGLDRFSEDLGFSLDSPRLDFEWAPHTARVLQILDMHGLECEGRSTGDPAGTVRSLMLSTPGPQEGLRFGHRPGRLLRVRLETDIDPPSGAVTSISYLDFPITHPLRCYDLPSGFAGKCHALLCRDHLKGRDFFDFTWYVGRGVVPNLALLSSSLAQAGPWKGKDVEPDPAWLVRALSERFSGVDWDEAKRDVMPFLDDRQRRVLEYWGSGFFEDRLARLERSMS